MGETLCVIGLSTQAANMKIHQNTLNVLLQIKLTFSTKTSVLNLSDHRFKSPFRHNLFIGNIFGCGNEKIDLRYIKPKAKI